MAPTLAVSTQGTSETVLGRLRRTELDRERVVKDMKLAARMKVAGHIPCSANNEQEDLTAKRVKQPSVTQPNHMVETTVGTSAICVCLHNNVEKVNKTSQPKKLGGKRKEEGESKLIHLFTSHQMSDSRRTIPDAAAAAIANIFLEHLHRSITLLERFFMHPSP